jgi:succinate dehydrogenase flavin-adding protein (antitoxin of CptAB toxin-antitoxin module)
VADKPLDWSKLPKGLEYLAEPAARYGALQFDGSIFDFLENQMSPANRNELQELGRLMARDWDVINSWLDAYPMTEHREAALVYFTVHLLALGGDAGLI